MQIQEKNDIIRGLASHVNSLTNGDSTIDFVKADVGDDVWIRGFIQDVDQDECATWTITEYGQIVAYLGVRSMDMSLEDIIPQQVRTFWSLDQIDRATIEKMRSDLGDMMSQYWSPER